jgi:hypothetical protein
MSKLRKSARGQMCTLQIYPHCNNNPETTVLAHIPSNHKGLGMKSPDYFGVYSCHNCHDVIDGRIKTNLNKEEILRCQLRALERTWSRMIEAGLISHQ